MSFVVGAQKRKRPACEQFTSYGVWGHAPPVFFGSQENWEISFFFSSRPVIIIDGIVSILVGFLF